MKLISPNVFVPLLSIFSTVSAITIAEINGDRFVSSYRNQNVSDVAGIVSAKGPDGFWLRSTEPDKDDKTSESVYVFGRSALTSVAVGDSITLNGQVTEFRTSPAFLFLTEITRPGNITVISKGNTVTPIVIGDRSLDPPTEQYSSLDNGDVFSLPNNASQISVENPVLDPKKFGLDFWESLSGELVTVQGARAVSRPNRFGDTWVVGNWKTTGENERDGLTMTDRGASRSQGL